MTIFNVVIKDALGEQQQYGVAASTWAFAIAAAKKEAGLPEDETSDDSLVIVQRTGRLDVTGE